MQRALLIVSIAVLFGGVLDAAAQDRPTPTARPTRPPRHNIHPSRPSTPHRPIRPARPERGTPIAATPTPALQPTTTAISGSTATPTPTRTPAQIADCATACPFYNLSQMRLTWYDAASGGLNLSFYVQPGDCPGLTPEAGEEVSIQMSRWLTERKVDTGRLHIATTTLGAGGSGATSTGGNISIGAFGSWQQVSYRATTPPIAGPQDGALFPVVFDLCLTVGNQAVKGRMVCQEKNRGLLCHEG